MTRKLKLVQQIKMQFPLLKNETFASKMQLLRQKCDISDGVYARVNTLTRTRTWVEDTHLKITVYHCQNEALTMTGVIDSHVTVVFPKYNNSFFSGNFCD